MQSGLTHPLSVCRIGNISHSQFGFYERTFARGVEIIQFTCRKEVLKVIARNALKTVLNQMFDSGEWNEGNRSSRVWKVGGQELLTMAGMNSRKVMINK